MDVLEIEAVDRLIRSGRSVEAQAMLRRRFANGYSVDRGDSVAWAKLCRRTNWSEAGLRILRPFVRPSARNEIQAFSIEIIEYAHNLVQLGLLREATELLERVPKTESSASLVRAMGAFAEWNYDGAIPHLNQYLADEKLEPYARLVGEMNLAAALTWTKAPEARNFLTEFRERCRHAGQQLLLGNALELSAQAAIEGCDFAEAKIKIAEARKLLVSHTGADSLFLEKWSIVLRALRSSDRKKRLNELSSLAAKAAKMGQWELRRDCEFYRALIGPKSQLAKNLYYGSPSPHFRARIERELSFQPSSRAEAWQKIGAGKVIRIGPDGVGELKLKSGQVLSRMVMALSRDAFRPISLPEIFAAIFPERFYDPQFSPPLVHQALFRLRSRLEAESIPLAIAESNGLFAWKSESPLRVEVPVSALNDPGQFSRKEISRWRELKWFTRAEYEIQFSMSTRSAQLRLRELTEDQVLEQKGRGPATKFRLLK